VGNLNILVTGCGGMLGEAVHAEFKHDHTVYATDTDLNEKWLSYLDIRNFEALEESFAKLELDAVIHLAALTGNEYCESNAHLAYDINFIGTYNIVKLAKKYDIPMVYISSGIVFGGRKPSYAEEDAPDPLNVYAKSKFAGELAVMSYFKTIIIRAGWMIGGGPIKDKMFMGKIMRQIKAGNKVLHIVKDRVGSLTYTYDLAKIIHHLLINKKYGIFHGVCSNSVTKIDIAQEILLCLGLSIKETIIAVSDKREVYLCERCMCTWEKANDIQ
jgi:dTDP-4-dehydrorhamnose reductase